MDSSAESPVSNDIELGPVTHWPTVYAAVGVAAVVLVGLAAVVVLAAVQPAPPPDTPEAVAAVLPAPPPRPRGMTVKTADPVAPPAVADVVPAPEPSPAEVSLPSPTPAPIRVATAVTPLIRVSNPAPATEPPLPPPAPPPEFALFDDLQAHVHEIDLDAVQGTTAKLLGPSRDVRSKRESVKRPPAETENGSEGIVQVIARRPDLEGLPVRGDTECKTPAAAAEGIQVISRALRRLQTGLLPSDAPLHYDRTYAMDPEAFYDSALAPDRNTESSINKDILCRHWDAGIFDEGLQQPGLELQFDQGFDDVVP